MICQRSSLIRQPCDFETSILCCCSWRTFWTLSLNTERAADIHYWSVWSVDEKRCAKLDSLLNKTCWIFRTQLHVHLKKMNINCCVCWTTFIILIKFAGYVDWILICKLCKFGKCICYNFRDIKFFLGGYFFGLPCRSVWLFTLSLKDAARCAMVMARGGTSYGAATQIVTQWGKTTPLPPPHHFKNTCESVVLWFMVTDS